MVQTKTEENLCQKTRLSPRLPPKVLLKSAWQVRLEGHDQRGTSVGQPPADEAAKEPQWDFRTQGTLRAEVEQEEENCRKQLFGRLVRAVMHHPNKDAPTADLQSKHPCSPISEESKQMIHSGKRGMFRTVQHLSPQNPCPYCLKFWTEGILYCDCGTCLVPAELTRKLSGESFDALTVPSFVIDKGGGRGARHGKSEAQREYHQAKVCLRKAHKKGFTTTLQRFQGCETYRNSQLHVWWDEDFCKHLDEIAQEDHSYVAVWQARQRYEKDWQLCLNNRGPVGPMKSRPACPEAVRRVREIKQEAEEAGYEMNPTIRPYLQVRKGPGPQFQPWGKPAAWTVDPKNGWLWWLSSTTWWSSTEWNEVLSTFTCFKVFPFRQ